jgi:hypothetical protein
MRKRILAQGNRETGVQKNILLARMFARGPLQSRAP